MEIANLSPEQIERIRKQFSSISQTSEETVVVHDWLDDSVQTVRIK